MEASPGRIIKKENTFFKARECASMSRIEHFHKEENLILMFSGSQETFEK